MEGNLVELRFGEVGERSSDLENIGGKIPAGVGFDEPEAIGSMIKPSDGPLILVVGVEEIA